MDKIAQKSEEWYLARRYKFTSSNVYKLMSEPKAKVDKDAGNLSQTAITYILEKVAEEAGGIIPETGAAATEWGEQYEPLARTWYEKKSGFKVEEIGFVQYSDFYGGSPDSKVTQMLDGSLVEGGLEIKCPYNSRVHIEHCLIDSAEAMLKGHPDKYWQCMSHMLTMGVGFCDFVSFDPRIDSELGFFCFRLIRNEEHCKMLEDRLKKAHQKKLEFMEILKIENVVR